MYTLSFCYSHSHFLLLRCEYQHIPSSAELEYFLFQTLDDVYMRTYRPFATDLFTAHTLRVNCSPLTP